MKKLFFLIPLTLILAGCNIEENNKTEQARKAEAAANSIRFNENAEIDNIKKRLELTSNPSQIGFVVLMNGAGQPILYESVVGKVTSGGKRLTSPDRTDCASTTKCISRAAPSDEGTWGSSSQYIFYWNTAGEYRQWNGDYLYSDKPLRLRVEPLVITVVDKK